MKTFLAIFVVVLLGVAAIFLYRGCNSSKSEAAKENDVLKDQLNKITVEGEARYKLDSSLIHDLTVQLQDTTNALQQTRKQFTAQGKQILATNKRLREAFNNHDTLMVYEGCDSMSHAIDSIAQVKWNVDRELDRQIVLNEQLRLSDSTALANCRSDLKNTRSAGYELLGSYEAQHQRDQTALKKAKKGRWIDRLIGGVAAEVVRGFVSIFKK